MPPRVANDVDGGGDEERGDETSDGDVRPRPAGHRHAGARRQNSDVARDVIERTCPGGDDRVDRLLDTKVAVTGLATSLCRNCCEASRPLCRYDEANGAANSSTAQSAVPSCWSRARMFSTYLRHLPALPSAVRAIATRSAREILPRYVCLVRSLTGVTAAGSGNSDGSVSGTCNRLHSLPARQR